MFQKTDKQYNMTFFLKYFINILIISLLFFSCQPKAEKNKGKLKVVATTGMIGDALKQISGDSVEVNTLMGPGVDPHLYKATQGDLTLMSDADMIFYNGLHLEGKMGEILEKLKRTKQVYAVADGLKTSGIRQSDTYENAPDPHIWFDVELWSQAVRYAGEVLAEADTLNTAYYEQNMKTYLSALDSLDQWVASELKKIPEGQRIMITAHDAFGYFGEAYGIDVRGLQGISTLSDIGLQDVIRLVNFIIEKKIKAVFVETSVSDKALRAVIEGCREKGHEVKIGGSLFSDAMGESGTPEGNYVGMVRHNVTTIVEALR
jgi:manganese/zinc/iron transport system substrate-binding protein